MQSSLKTLKLRSITSAAQSQYSGCRQGICGHRRAVSLPQVQAPDADMTGVRRCWIIALFFSLLCGCGGDIARMEHPEDPQGHYREQIAAATRLLMQKEDWADRAEWEVLKSGDGWKVVAWRVEHADRTGPDRYLPWGYSVIELDRRMIAVHYDRKG